MRHTSATSLGCNRPTPCAEAAAWAPKLLGDDRAAWEQAIFTFGDAQQLPLLATEIPTASPTLSRTAYALTAKALLAQSGHHEALQKLLEAWPHEVTGSVADELLAAIDAKLLRAARDGGGRGPPNEALHRAAALLHRRQARSHMRCCSVHCFSSGVWSGLCRQLASRAERVTATGPADGSARPPGRHACRLHSRSCTVQPHQDKTQKQIKGDHKQNLSKRTRPENSKKTDQKLRALQGHHEQALDALLRISDPAAFDLIAQFGLFAAAGRDAGRLLNVDEGAAVSLLVANSDAAAPDVVGGEVLALQRRAAAAGRGDEAAVWRRRMFLYLRALFAKERQATHAFQDLQARRSLCCSTGRL